MRLTLRTLLAYLDEILDPHDAEQLRKKIEDSEFATSLVHQIRGSVRRLRLDAPALDAQGIGADLNSVAEYLDNTLPPDQVPALEKICLDNEVHLGEVASCHQILTLVLGQAANISESLRRNVYDIAATVEHPAPPIPNAPSAHPPAQPPAQPPSAATSFPSSAPPTRDSDAAAGSAGIMDRIPAPKAISSATTSTTRPQRPSERFSKPTDIPSTKETWRAESQAMLTAATDSEASPVAAVATVTTAPPPEYMPRAKKYSWLKRLTILVVILLLIAAGLVVAIGPVNEHIAQWLGLGTRRVATNHVDDMQIVRPEVPQAPLVESPPEVLRIEQADASVNRWQPPATQSTEATAAIELVPSEPASTLELATVDQEPESPFLAAPLNDPSFDAGVGAEDIPAGEGSRDAMPSLEPDDASLSNPNQQTHETLPDDSARIVENDVPDVVEFDPNLPLKHVPTPETPNSGDVASTLAEPNIPRGIDNSGMIANPLRDEPIVAPDLDLEPVFGNPPVPSPAPPSSAATTLLPEEPQAPQPEESRTLAPVRLRPGHLLARFDAEANDWIRVDAAVPLVAGDAVLSLPAFRADLDIGTDFTCTLVGPTRLKLGPEANVSLDSGQLALQTKSAMRSQGIQHRGETFDIWTSEAEGVVAVEASRVLIPGSDPLTDMPHTILRIYATSGDATVRFNGQTFDIPQGQHLLRLDNFTPRLASDPRKPKWMSATFVSRADLSAVSDWKRSLELDNVRNMNAWLRQRANNRHYNQRALASRCLAELDQFGAVVTALRDREQHPFWDQQFESLQRALSRGPDTARRVLSELEKDRGSDAVELFEMIRGYDAKQLAQGAAAKLVDNLGHESLDYRVLAIQNLKRITGFTQAFMPEKSIGDRRNAVNQWKRKLRMGRIVYARLPEVVTLLESFTEPALTNIE
jgi:hypothetical protein